MVVFDPLDHSGYPVHLDSSLPDTTPVTPISPPIQMVTIGTRLSVYWPDDDAHYNGTVTGKNSSGLYQVSYDDGDFEELDLTTEIYTLLPSTESSTPSSSSISHLFDLNTMPDTDDVDRWKMLHILDHREVGPHKTELKIQLDSGETSWLPLSIVKRSNPNLYAGYALTKRGTWANTFRRQRRQLNCLCSNIFKTSTVLYKYGFRLPRSSKEALEIDKSAGNTLWADAIHKEMCKIEKFNVFKEASSIPAGYERLRCMLIFDIKLDGTHKARLVADGSGSPVSTDSYSSVIDPDHVRLALIVATLNGLDHCMIDLEDAYLHALTKELAYTYLPPEFGTLGGRTLIFHKALYGMRTSGACFHAAKQKGILY